MAEDGLSPTKKAKMEDVDAQFDKGCLATAKIIYMPHHPRLEHKSTKELNPREPVPSQKLQTTVPEGYRPIVVVSVGSFSPPTLMHMRIMEEAKFALHKRGMFAIGGYMSPTHQKYGKKALAPMHHRVDMVGAAVEDSTWIMADYWECAQQDWTPTVHVLDRYARQLAHVPVSIGGQPPKTGLIQVVMVCGADLVKSFLDVKPDGSPVWLPQHVEQILSNFGLVAFEREGSSLAELLEADTVLKRYKHHIFAVRPFVTNNISSTLVRELLRQGCSLKYLVPDPVLEYIYRHKLDELACWINPSQQVPKPPQEDSPLHAPESPPLHPAVKNAHLIECEFKLPADEKCG